MIEIDQNGKKIFHPYRKRWTALQKHRIPEKEKRCSCTAEFTGNRLPCAYRI